MPKIRVAAEPAADDYDDEPVIGTRQMEARTVMRETRDADERPGVGHNDPPSDYVWRRPTSLDAPPARAGYAQRWIRMAMRAEKDTINWSNKYREGWQPRDPATLPQEYRYLKGAAEGLGGAIVVGGLVLCEIPERILQAKARYLRDQVAKQDQSVSTDTDTVSREGARLGAPPVVRDEQINVSRGRRPSTSLAD